MGMVGSKNFWRKSWEERSPGALHVEELQNRQKESWSTRGGKRASLEAKWEK